MVSGVGPAATLSAHAIPLIADRPGVGQNMWVSQVTLEILKTYRHYQAPPSILPDSRS